MLDITWIRGSTKFVQYLPKSHNTCQIHVYHSICGLANLGQILDKSWTNVGTQIPSLSKTRPNYVLILSNLKSGPHAHCPPTACPLPAHFPPKAHPQPGYSSPIALPQLAYGSPKGCPQVAQSLHTACP